MRLEFGRIELDNRAWVSSTREIGPTDADICKIWFMTKIILVKVNVFFNHFETSNSVTVWLKIMFMYQGKDKITELLEFFW